MVFSSFCNCHLVMDLKQWLHQLFQLKDLDVWSFRRLAATILNWTDGKGLESWRCWCWRHYCDLLCLNLPGSRFRASSSVWAASGEERCFEPNKTIPSEILKDLSRALEPNSWKLSIKATITRTWQRAVENKKSEAFLSSVQVDCQAENVE